MRTWEEMEAINEAFEEGRSQGFREAARALARVADTGLWDDAVKQVKACRRRGEMPPYEAIGLITALRQIGITPYGELSRRWTARSAEDLDGFVWRGPVIWTYPIEVSTVYYGWRFKEALIREPVVVPYNEGYNPDFDWG